MNDFASVGGSKIVKNHWFLQHFLKFGFLEKVGIQNPKSYVFELQKGPKFKVWDEKRGSKNDKSSGSKKRGSKIEN